MAFNVKRIQQELEQEGSLERGYDSYESARKKHRKIQQSIKRAENEIAYAILNSEIKE